MLKPRAILQNADRVSKLNPKPESARKTGFCTGWEGREATSSKQLAPGQVQIRVSNKLLSINREINLLKKDLKQTFLRCHVTFFRTMEHAFRRQMLLLATTYLLNPNCLGFCQRVGDIGPFFYKADDGASDLSQPQISHLGKPLFSPSNLR